MTGINVGFDKAPTATAISKAPSVAALTGVASWYSYFEGQAAAGPALRVALGPNWRGKIVETCSANDPSRCVRVQLTDMCQCLSTRLVDLDARDFARLAPLSQGLLNVEVTW